MNSEHTPGPWKIQPRQYRTDDLVVMAGDCVVARVAGKYAVGEPEYGNGYYTPYGDADANAYLIAAAPDLLSACEAVLHEWRNSDAMNNPDADGHAVLQQVRRAVGKARS